MPQQLIIEQFTEESWNHLTEITFSALFQRLEVIKTKITQEHQNGKIQMFTFEGRSKAENAFQYARLNTRKSAQSDRELLYEAYEIIQAIREKMTGEVLTYRLFITTTDHQVKSIDVGARDLKSVLSLTGKEIDISVSKLKVYMEADKNKQRVDTSLTEKYRQLMPSSSGGYFEKAGNFWRVPSRSAPPLKMHKKPPPNDSQYVVYTKGHIIEALNKAMTKYLAQVELGEEADPFISSFADMLSYDSVSGFKGGDDKMLQIKANSARLMRYTSIMNAINQVLNIRLAIASGKEKSDIRHMVRELYENSGANNSINQITDQQIDKIVDDLMKNLT